MKIPHRKVLWQRACIASVVLLLSAATSFGQTSAPAQAANTGSIRGQVVDPSGAAVVNATILLTTPSGASMDTTSNKDGVYEFKNLAPGTYQIKAVAEGFSLFSKDGIAVTAGQVARVNIALEIQVQQEKVQVNADTAQVDVNPSNNANSITLSGKELDALSDDPDELESELQALAGPSAGPNGGQIYIDGFTAGQLPPKASIREIRINQNPFSSEYDKLGYGRIEIFTKPGTDKWHGQVMVLGNTQQFNARNPFEILPEGTSPPSYNSEQYSGNIGGPLGKNTSFFFTIDRRNIGALGVVNGTVVCGDQFLQIPCGSTQPQYSIIPYSDAVTNPQTRTNLSPRLDYQLTPSNTLTGRYQYFRDVETNSGVGQFVLAQQGVDTLETEDTVQVTDTQTVSATTINEVRFQYIHDDTLTNPVSTAVSVNVGGAFNGVGSGGGTVSDIENHYEIQDIIYKTYTKHSVKFGGRLRSITDNNSTASNFTGTFTFGAQTLYGCNTTTTTCPTATPIQVYQDTVEGLAAGLTIPEIQQTYGYGGAAYYSQNAGAAYASVNLTDLGLFAQDDWKVRPNLTVSYGLRFETQNHLADTVDFAPRLGIAWGIDSHGKSPAKTVLRAGFGMFYDRFTYNLLLPQYRFNVADPLQQQFLITNPQFFVTGNAECVPPLPVPIPPACAGTAGTGNETIDYQYNPNLHAPYTMQTGVTVERQVSRAANIAVTYLNSRGVHQFYTDNLNPANPAAVTPVASSPILQYESEGIFKQNQLIVNGRINLGAKLMLFGYYTLNYSDADTAGPTSMISIPGEPWKDYGPSAYDVRNRIFLGGTYGMPWSFRLSPFLIYSSGIPFNITTGTDPFGDNAYNVRPAFAPCATAQYQTKFGCFSSPIAADYDTYTPIPTYDGIGPGRFALMLRLSKTIGFGPVIEGANNNAGAGPGGSGTFGRPTRGGGGPGGRGGGFFDSGNTNRRYALTFGIVARNVFNNVNTLPLIGNLSSPLFGEANGLVGRPYSDPTSNRRLDLQVTFTF